MDLAALMPLRATASVSLMIALAIRRGAAGGDRLRLHAPELHETMSMSRREIKEEMRQSDGDPMVKAKLRHDPQRSARGGACCQNVPKASVVITNPTHYAMALQHDAGRNRRRRSVWP